MRLKISYLFSKVKEKADLSVDSQQTVFWNANRKKQPLQAQQLSMGSVYVA